MHENPKNFACGAEDLTNQHNNIVRNPPCSPEFLARGRLFIWSSLDVSEWQENLVSVGEDGENGTRETRAHE